MSHFKERKEKNCLNCNTQVNGRFCQACGQENLETKESVGHLVSHFFNDITHFDGQIFSSLKLLIVKPGFLAKDYMIGKRASHLNPVRMYILMAAIFFTVFFTVFGGDKLKDAKPPIVTNDSSLNKEHIKALNDSVKDGVNNKSSLRIGSVNSYQPNTIAEYDSFQQTLPSNKRDYWILRNLHYSSFKLYNKKTGILNEEGVATIVEKFMHAIPQQTLITLPFFALLLKLMYWKRKEYYYTNHAIFAIYFYIFTYLAALVITLFSYLSGLFWKPFWSWMEVAVFLLILFYEYKAMRNFYGQSSVKTILSFIVVNIGSIIFALCLFCIYLLIFFINIK